MGQIKQPHPVKLVVGCIYKDSSVCARAKKLLVRRFGPVDFESPELSFTQTDYYEKEFGSGLKKLFISSQRLIPPDRLASIKIITNKIEKRLSVNNNRLINLDPGYITAAKYVLATAKDYNHRIYLSRGIYAEVTMHYQQHTFHPWPWTYRDFKTDEYLKILNQIRAIYIDQIKLKR